MFTVEKQVLALSYVLIHAHDDGTTFANRQWDLPLIIRSNGKEFHIPLYVDLANQQILPSPKENSDPSPKENSDISKQQSKTLALIQR